MAKITQLSTPGDDAGVFDDPVLQSMLGCGDAGIGFQQTGQQEIPLKDCHPWHDEENSGQPFRMYPKAKLDELAADMAVRGLDNPIIVRHYEGGYQILAGHNRVEAARIIGWVTIPAKVVKVDDDAARLILVNTNLHQRDKILPSERAKAYKLQLDSMKRQGKRNDLTCSQFGNRLDGKKSGELLAEQLGESKNQIFRYIRLNELVPELLEMVDNEQLPFTVGVSLSYLNHAKQQLLVDTMIQNGITTLNGKQADFFKSQGETLNETTIHQLFGITDSNSVPTSKPPKPITIRIPAELWGDIPMKLAKDMALIRRIVADSKQYAEEIKCRK